MTLGQIKTQLSQSETIAFQLPDGRLVPAHFHVTEVGKVTKDFIDCGGTVRHEEVANFQLWEADDYDHRLHPEKLVHIIELSQKVLGLGDLEIEVEYQGDTIGKYGLDYNGKNFLLTSKSTACLAREECGVPLANPLNPTDFQNPSDLGDLAVVAQAPACKPGSGCC